MEVDRLKVTPHASCLPLSPSLDEEELHATVDGQLLSHLIGEVLEVGFEEPGLSSFCELTTSGRKSKAKLPKNNKKSSKRTKISKPSIVSQ